MLQETFVWARARAGTGIGKCTWVHCGRDYVYADNVV